MRNYSTTIINVVLAIVAKVVFLIRSINGSGKEISLHISRENKKLKPNSATAFIIWNLPSVFTCPFRTIHCLTDCYARKAENAYPTVLPSRTENYLMSLRDDFVELMTNEILRIAKGTKKPIIIVRVHESGDFYNQKYTDKWLHIMENCLVDKRIRFIAYTKSFPFFDGKKLPSNFSLRASIWDDTSEEQKAIVKRNGWPIYTAVEKFSNKDAFHQCRCADCATCAKCWDYMVKDIRCEIH